MAFELVHLRLQHFAPQHPVFVCRVCRTDLALFSYMVSPYPGPWILREINGDVGIVFSRVENVITVHQEQPRVRVAGFRTEIIACRTCHRDLGWNYLEVPEGSRLTPGMTYLLWEAVDLWDRILVQFDEAPGSPHFYMCAQCGTGLAYDEDITDEDYPHLRPAPNDPPGEFILFDQAFNLQKTYRYMILRPGNLFTICLLCKNCNKPLGVELTETENGEFQNVTRVTFGLYTPHVQHWPED